MHPFTPVGKNLELLLVCDKKDLDSWQKQTLPLSIVTKLKETSRTGINHIRYVADVNGRNTRSSFGSPQCQCTFRVKIGAMSCSALFLWCFSVE